ncbi:MAG TPA: hypothetical protein VGN55_06870, partial [Xanthobacteraceae bacterium]
KAVQEIDFSDGAPLAPAAPAAPSSLAPQVPPSAQPVAAAPLPGQRPSLLRKPLDAGGAPPAGPAPGGFRLR